MTNTVTNRGTADRSYTTDPCVIPSFTPSADSVLFLAYMSAITATEIVGHGTWVQIATGTQYGMNCFFCYCVIGGSPGASTVEVRYPSTNAEIGAICFEVSEADGIHATNFNSWAGIDGASPLALSLPSAPSQLTVAIVGEMDATVTVAQQTAVTGCYRNFGFGQRRLLAEYSDPGTQSMGATWTGSQCKSFIMAAEISIPGGGGGGATKSGAKNISRFSTTQQYTAG